MAFNLTLLFILFLDSVFAPRLVDELDVYSSYIILLIDLAFRLHKGIIIFLLASSVFLLGYRRYRMRPGVCKDFMVFFLSLIMLLMILEFGLRHYYPKLGVFKPLDWCMGEGHTYRYDIPVAGGGTKLVENTMVENGFRLWGDTGSDKKAMVLGDSYTMMIYVSLNETWYSRLQLEFPDTDFFVHGCWGYGTVQQYLILEKYFDEIKPDLLIWQFCSNDYLTNSRDLALRQGITYVCTPVPYLDGQDIIYRPVRLPWIRGKSRVFSILYNWYETFYTNTYTYLMGRIGWDGTSGLHELLLETSIDPDSQHRKAVETTEAVFRLVDRETGDTPILLFNACGEISADEKGICSLEDVTCIPGVYERIRGRWNLGEQVFVEGDSHWNTYGNSLVADMLEDYFRENRIL